MIKEAYTLSIKVLLLVGVLLSFIAVMQLVTFGLQLRQLSPTAATIYAGTLLTVLVIGNTADDACTPSHTHRLYDAVSHDDKELAEIKGATHYYIGQKKELGEAIGVITDWLNRHDLV